MVNAAAAQIRRRTKSNDKLVAARRNVALRDIGAGAEEMALHLLGQIITGFFVGKIEAVFIDQHLLQFQPFLPGLLRYVIEDAFAELARIGRKIQPFRFASQFYALDNSRHGDCYKTVLQICYAEIAFILTGMKPRDAFYKRLSSTFDCR